MSENKGLMAGKRGLIMGVANNRSIAWGIAKSCAAQGAELAFTYQGDALKKRVEPLAAEIGSKIVVPCDVTDTASLDAAFATVQEKWGSLDFVVHAIAFSDKDELTGRYVDTTPDNFTKTMFISVYSFTAVAQRAEKLMTNGGSLLTLTYYGAEKWMPHYNVMGVAKAGLEAFGALSRRRSRPQGDPRQCHLGRADQDARRLRHRRLPLHPALERIQLAAPPHRHHRRGGRFRLLPAVGSGRGVTGEILHVDAGYHIVGMKNPDAPDITVNGNGE